MIFLHPEFLWGFWALLIPIFVHLFDFRKSKKVLFPDIRFLKEVKQHSRKPLKLKQWLILIARLGFIIFLVLIFAQPTIPSENTNQIGKETTLIYIDNSQSMSSLANAKESLFEEAKTIVQGVINQMPKEQELILITNDDFGKFMPPINLSQASEKLPTIHLSEKPFSLQKLGAKISEYTRGSTKISDVILISDFQKSTSELLENNLDTTLTYWISQLTPENIQNCVVDTVYLEDSGIFSDGDKSINVIVSNTGKELKEDMPIKIFVGDRQVSASSITIPAYQTRSVSFSPGKLEGTSSGYIQLEDYPNTFDNRFNFSLPPNRLINVLEIVGDNPSPYIKPVFGNTKIFSFDTNNYQNIDNELFENSDFIIINQIQSPTKEIILQLKSLAAKEKVVLVVPTSANNLAVYQLFLPKLKSEKLPAKQKVMTPSSTSPFFNSIIEKTTQKFEMPSATPVWSWGQDKSAILSFENGTPYLSEVIQNVFFLRGPLEEPLSDFQTHALFVPVMYGLASRSATPNGQLFDRIQDEYYDLLIKEVAPKDLIKLIKEEIEIIPNRISLGAKERVSFPKALISTGTYKISVQDSVIGYLSINLDKKESLLSPMAEDDIRNMFKDHKFVLLDEYNPNQDNLISFDSGIRLWRYALTICLLFLLMETLFIRFK